MAHMARFESSILVIPNPVRTRLVPEGLPIKIKYLPEDFVGEDP
jgi:hypothetical protein